MSYNYLILFLSELTLSYLKTSAIKSAVRNDAVKGSAQMSLLYLLRATSLYYSVNLFLNSSPIFVGLVYMTAGVIGFLVAVLTDKTDV